MYIDSDVDEKDMEDGSDEEDDEGSEDEEEASGDDVDKLAGSKRKAEAEETEDSPNKKAHN